MNILFGRAAGLPVDPFANVGAASRWRARLYAFMQRNTPSPTFLLGAPADRLIEIGVQYEL
jgi:K+ transporter